MITNTFLKDPVFAANVALVCCALHVCERASCPFEDSWIPSDAGGIQLQAHVALPGAGAELQALITRDARTHSHAMCTTLSNLYSNLQA